MSQKEKLTARLLNRPKDFTIDELDALCGKLGLVKGCRGKTSGSAIEYFSPQTGHILKIHSPHPGNELKPYMLNIVIGFLQSEGLI